MTAYAVQVTPYGPGKLIVLQSPALQVSISTLGATLHSVRVYQPQQQKWVEVNLQYNSFDEAVADTDTYLGPTVGRYAGRISNGRFVLDNAEFETPKNAGQHTIHSGGNAFDKKQWGYRIDGDAADHRCLAVSFVYTSPHMENGFPGELACTTRYSIAKADPNQFRIDFHAEITPTSPAEATIVNMFNHAYWNLNGLDGRAEAPDYMGTAQHDGTSEGAMRKKARNEAAVVAWKQPVPVLNHYIRLPYCDRVVETNEAAIPNGNLSPVRAALDLRRGCGVAAGIHDTATLNRQPCGYDHPFLISGWQPNQKRLRLNAEVSSPLTNIVMQVYSTFPCLWVYTANNLKDGASGAKGERFSRHCGICLEPQQVPDAVNHQHFPQSIVRRGAPYRESVVHVFTTSSSDSSKL